MSDLVFDIGMHNGDDTAYYLARGYRVVAVEANPGMCETARERFAAAIGTGQLSIRNIAIAETQGEMDFWISSDASLSSFNAEHATKNDAQATHIKVETMPFRQLMEQYGTPFFVKIDIEGSDSLCLRDLEATASRPAYLSFEAGDGLTNAHIKLLESLGYRSFKCVRQNDLREITPRNVIHQGEFQRVLKGLNWLPRIGIRHITWRFHYRRRPVNGWQFSLDSSGPLGMELPGRWLTTDEVLLVWYQLVAYELRLYEGGQRPIEWFDIHAAHESAER
jgi:FkbM family methyltransferase